jgi:hypothetical protein
MQQSLAVEDYIIKSRLHYDDHSDTMREIRSDVRVALDQYMEFSGVREALERGS